jgi:hypothetical protein
MRRDVLALLDMITPCIVFVEIDNRGLFPTIHVSETIPILKPIPVSEPVPVSKPIPASKPVLPYENFPAGTLTTTNQTEFAPSGAFQRRNFPGGEQNFWKTLAFLITSLIYLMEYRLRRS